jgi:hypothetical protein
MAETDVYSESAFWDQWSHDAARERRADRARERDTDPRRRAVTPPAPRTRTGSWPTGGEKRAA